jgi:hypothetical protein
VEFVVYKVALRQVFLRVLRLSHVGIMPSKPLIHHVKTTHRKNERANTENLRTDAEMVPANAEMVPNTPRCYCMLLM